MKIPLGDYCIRSYRFSDKDALAKYANNFNIQKRLRDKFPYPYKKEDAERWLGIVCNQNPEMNFAIANDDELIGAIGLVAKDDVNRYTAEIGYWLAEPFWGKGISTSAVKAMTKFAFDNFEFNRIYADVFEGNKASMKVLENAGYKLEAHLRKSVHKDGKFLDQFIYSILREEFKSNRQLK